jgi:hypothetical protein
VVEDRGAYVYVKGCNGEGGSPLDLYVRSVCMSDEENMQVGCSVGVVRTAKQLNICGDI